MKKKYSLWLLYIVLPLFILLFHCGLKTYAGTDPLYNNTGYLLTKNDLYKILQDITITDDYTYTEEELINMTNYYNTWAREYKQNNPTYTTDDTMFCYPKTGQYILGNGEIVFLTSNNANLTDNPYLISINGIPIANNYNYIIAKQPYNVTGTPPNLVTSYTRDCTYYILFKDKPVQRITNSNRKSELDIVYKSPITIRTYLTDYLVDIKTITTTKASAVNSTENYEIIYEYRDGTDKTYYMYLDNFVHLSGSGDNPTPTPTPTPTTTPTPTQSGDSSGDNSGDVPGIIDYTGKLEDINNTIDSGDRGIIASITNLPGLILNGLIDVLKGIFNWIMNLLFTPDMELVNSYLTNLTNLLGGNDLLSLNTYIISKELGLMQTQNIGEFIIQWNDIEMFNQTVIPAGGINITEFVTSNEKLNTIYNYYIIIVSAGFIYVFAKFLRNIIFKILGLNWIGNLVEENDAQVTEIMTEDRTIDAETGELKTNYTRTASIRGNGKAQNKTYRIKNID